MNDLNELVIKFIKINHILEQKNGGNYNLIIFDNGLEHTICPGWKISTFHGSTESNLDYNFIRIEYNLNYINSKSQITINLKPSEILDIDDVTQFILENGRLRIIGNMDLKYIESSFKFIINEYKDIL